MCTDVDRNDKSRICAPGSIKVIGRRQIEMYSRLIHTVDHIEGTPAARLRRAGRVPHAHVGGDGDRGAEELGHAVHRGPRGAAAALVRRRRRDDRLRRRHEHRPDPAHGPHHRGRGRRPGRRHAAVRLRPGRGGARDRAEGPRPAGDAGRGRGRRRGTGAPVAAAVPPAAEPGAAAAGAGPARCCWWITRTRSCTRWPATSGSRAPRSRRCGPASTPGCWTSTRRTWWCCRPGPAARPTSSCDKLLAALDERGLPAFGVCLGLQAMVEHAGGSLGLLATPVHGKPGQVQVLGRPAAGRAPGRVHRGPVPLAARAAGPGGAAASRSPPSPRTAS